MTQTITIQVVFTAGYKLETKDLGINKPCLIAQELVVVFLPRPPGFDSWSSHEGFVVEEVVLGQVFSESFGFPCQSSHRLLHTHNLPSSGAGTIGQIVADIPSGLKSHPTQRNTKDGEPQAIYCPLPSRGEGIAPFIIRYSVSINTDLFSVA
jgi:hypothetical protein